MQPSIHIQQEAADTFFTLRMIVLLCVGAILVVGGGLFVLIGLSSGGYTYTATQAEETSNALIMKVNAEPTWHARLFAWQRETFVVVGKKSKVLWVFDGDVEWVREDGRELPSNARQRLNDAWAVLDAKQEITRTKQEE